MLSQYNASGRHNFLYFWTLFGLCTGYLDPIVCALGGSAAIVINGLCSASFCSYSWFNIVLDFHRIGMVILSTEYRTDITSTCACFSLCNIQLSVRHKQRSCLTALTGTSLD